MDSQARQLPCERNSIDSGRSSKVLSPIFHRSDYFCHHAKPLPGKESSTNGALNFGQL